MISKAQARRDALVAWWERGPWPCVILAVDSGADAGAARFVSRPGGLELREATAVDTYGDRLLESFVKRAFDDAGQLALPLIAVLEDWGRGGPRGLSQWVGLGETRGPWRREVLLRASEAAAPRTKIVLATQSRWRSRVIEETGDSSSGTWEPFGPAGWKAAAFWAAREHILDAHVPPLDAAEATCIGVYAARSDEVGKALGKRHLRKWGLEFELLEPAINLKRPKRTDLAAR